jgi:hypothetical protein
MTLRVFLTADNSDYLLEPLREEADFTLYRGRERAQTTAVLGGSGGR